MKNLLCVGILVALPGLAQAGKANSSSQTVLGVPCSEIFERGIDMQENLRAGMIRVGCGLEAGGEAGEAHELDSILDLPGVNLITGAEILPHVTQSESMAWSTPDGQTIVVTYNDSRDVGSSPINIAGVSVSFDGGNTFERTSPHSPFTGHGANFGDPVVVYNERLQSWYAGFLASGCGPDGIAMWTSTDAMNWTAAPCAHNGGGDDRESMWVDNNSASPFYGRMYVSWNDFAAGQNIFVVYSDNGTTWSAPVQVNTGAAFVRNVQLTGSPGDDGTVFIAGMNEGGGGVNPRVNIIYRSLDGGAHWTAITMGPAFPPPGQAVCGYFAAIFPNWRHMGWGQPAVGPDGVVHYAYAARGANPGDDGDILYTRSENNGDTWSTPITLNSDAATGGNRVQWMPSLSVTPEGQVVVSWYDRRNTQGDAYEVWGIRSADNGMTWDPDERFSDRVIPQPEQPDPQIVFCYNGDYNYHSAVTGKNLLTWTDGRVQVNGHNQQDVFFAMVEQVITGGTLQGTVTDTTGAVVAGARVDAVGPVTRHASSNRDGIYRLIGLTQGAYDLMVTAFGYNPASASGVMVFDGQTTIQNFTLTAAPAHRVSGTVTNTATGLPVAGATVTIQGTPIPPATTDANGMYAFPMVPDGTYNIRATATGLIPNTQSVTVDQDVIVNFALDPVAVALFQDQLPWGSNQDQALLDARGISYQILDSSRMADADLTQFRKVILVSQQPDTFYMRLEASRTRFEGYVNGNGVLEMHLANFFGSQAERTMFPFGLRITPGFGSNTVSIVDPGDPIITTPNAITLAELQNWNYSAHGLLIGVDVLGLNVVTNNQEGPVGPVTAEGRAGTGNGTLVATDSPVEWQGTPNTRRFNENLICFALSGVGTCP